MAYSTIDLHCHSLASDGELSPRDVVERAVGNGVKTLALTDHDSIAGLDEARQAADRAGIELINGIEISCLWESHTIHVLGLNFSDMAIMADVEAQQSLARIQRAQEIAAKLVKKGLPDVLESATQLSSTEVPGRPHFAQALVEAGAVKDHSEAFKKYLGTGKVGDVKSVWPDLPSAVDWIKDSGGTAVIAHPRKYTMSLTKLRALITDFKELGGDAIEVVVSGQKQGEVGLLSDLCQRFDVHASLGSDFHSPRFAWADLGKIPCLPKSVRPVWELWH